MKLLERLCLLVTILAIALPAGATDEEFCGNIGRIVDKDEFTFAVWGDPQVMFGEVGYDFGYKTPMQPTFPRWVEPVLKNFKKSVEMTNVLDPAFVVAVGDIIHGNGEWENYNVFVDMAKPLKAPLYLLMGNHDWSDIVPRFKSNPYGSREFGNFLWAQKQLGQPELANYSFDAGKWHFILFSAPGVGREGMDAYMQCHPGFLEWLDADLKANIDKPVAFFAHHPLLPTARGMDIYNMSARNRRALVTTLTRYGNLKLAFFDHLHPPVAAIPKISWR